MFNNAFLQPCKQSFQISIINLLTKRKKIRGFTVCCHKNLQVDNLDYRKMIKRNSENFIKELENDIDISKLYRFSIIKC